MIYRLSDFMDRVTGDANGETITGTTAMVIDGFSYVGGGNIVRTKMNAVGSDCQSNIDPGVDEELRGRLRIFAYRADCFASQQFQFAGSQVFLAQLDEIHAVAGGFGNLL
jgi:hypothetical protein